MYCTLMPVVLPARDPVIGAESRLKDTVSRTGVTASAGLVDRRPGHRALRGGMLQPVLIPIVCGAIATGHESNQRKSCSKPPNHI